jgi:endonuclease I
MDQVQSCDITGSVDTSTAGTYTITYEAVGHDSTVETVEVNVLVLSSYYDDLAGLDGDALLSAMRTLLTDTMTDLSYETAITVLPISDADPLMTGQVTTVYDRISVDATWDSGTTWNREHVWPQSKLGSASDSDIHNLKPAVPSTNSSRGNAPFGYGSGDAGLVGDAFWPGEDDMGDIARIIFYMYVRYGLEITESVIGPLDMFESWHENDPVDPFEINRNDVISTYQDNRNPFIDYPLFYDLIFEAGSTT